MVGNPEPACDRDDEEEVASKTKKSGSKTAKPEKEQVQVYLLPEQIDALEVDRAAHEQEVHALMGPGRRLSRSAHGGSVIHNYLQYRQINPELSYAQFWEVCEKALQASKKKRGK